MAEGGWSSGKWGEAAWGMSVYARDVFDAAVAVDSDFTSANTYNAEAAELATGNDAIGNDFSVIVIIGETATASETTSANGSVLNSGVVEQVTGVEAVVAQQVLDTNVIEALTTADTIAAQQVFDTQISESSAGADTSDGSFAYFASASESASGTDTAATTATLYAQIQDAITARDEITVNGSIIVVQIGESGTVTDISAVAASAYNVDVIESLIAADAVLARLRWEPIDDDQSPNWTPVITV